MLQYIIQTILFQLIFLAAYDLFHKKDTFFTVNRMYLLVSSFLSFILPLIKVKSIQETISDDYVINLPTVFIGGNPLNTQVIQAIDMTSTSSLDINWWLLIYILGMSITAFLFIRKIRIIQSIRKNTIKGTINGVSVRIVPDSKDAFTFWDTVYLGNQLSDDEKDQILVHEMVHLTQKHTLDLIWFELIKILFWFDPLVYIYHFRMVALHEYISDSSAIKLLGKREYYEHLLNANFQTNNIKFANHFFNHKLLKKRILMLQKTKSQANAKLKYLAMIPLLLSMLTFTAFSQKMVSIAYISSEKFTEEIHELTNSFSEKESNDIMSGKAIPVPDDKAKHTKEILVKEEKEPIQKTAVPVVIQAVNRDTLSKADQKMVDRLLEIKDDVLNHRKSFASRAVLYSEDPGSKGNGGYYLVKKDTPFHESFKSIAFSTKKGEISEPFKTPFGWHILTVDKIETDGVGIRHILLLSQEKDEEVPFSVVEKTPSTIKCAALTDRTERKKCVSNEINQFVHKNFNIKIAEEIGLTGTNRIYVRFKIDPSGKIVDVQSRGPAIELEEEAIRVIQSLPDMIPGETGGKKVSVLYSLPIAFNIAPSANENKQQLIIQQDTILEETILKENLSNIKDNNVEKGYYLITGIFKHQNYLEKGITQLKKQGLQPKFFVNPIDKYIYVYLEKYETLKEAKKMRLSDFDGQYKEDLYILKIQ